MMAEGVQTQDRMERAMLEQAQAQLVEILGNIPNELPLVLFTTPLKNDLFSDAARKMIRGIRQLAPKVTLREYDLSHEMAQKWNAEHSPTLLIDPEHYNVRWLGAPIGEEALTFIELIRMIGYRKSGISEESRKLLQKHF